MTRQTRRKFLSKIFLGFGGLALLGEPLVSFWAKACGTVKKRVLATGTDRNSLINENQQDLDARNLEVTPLKDFGIMGLSDHQVDITRWELKVDGWVGNTLHLSYARIRAFPFIERGYSGDIIPIF